MDDLKRSENTCLVTVNGEAEIPMKPLIQRWPILENAVFYRIFPKPKSKSIVVRFYDKNKRWIRIDKDEPNK